MSFFNCFGGKNSIKDGEPDKVHPELRGWGWEREGGRHQQPEVPGSLLAVRARPSGAHAQARKPLRSSQTASSKSRIA